MTHLNNVFVGVSDTLRVRLTEVVHIKMTREDGSIEQRTIGDGG
jgi:hypothetical protein